MAMSMKMMRLKYEEGEGMLKEISRYAPYVMMVGLCLISEAAFGSGFTTEVRPDIFGKLVKWIDDNLAMGALMSSTGGAVIASGGDLRTRAQGAGIGFVTAMIVWCIAKAFVKVT